MNKLILINEGIKSDKLTEIEKERNGTFRGHTPQHRLTSSI